MRWERKLLTLFALMLLSWGAQTPRLQAAVENFGLKWAQAGGSLQGSCAIVDLAVDSTGASYVLADFYDNSEFGGMSFSTQGSYIVKQDADGNVVWKLKLLGGNLTQLNAKEVEVSPDGGIVVAGFYTGTGTIAEQTVQPILAPGVENSLADFFLLKLRPDSSVEWLITEDMNDDLSPFRQDILTLDPAGNIYTHNRYFIDVSIGGEAFTVPVQAGRGYLYAKYNSGGALQWCRSLAHYGRFAFGPGAETYFAYEFSASHQFGSQIFTTTGGTNVILSRLSSDGSVVWALQGGGTGRDTVDSMAVDGSGNVYLSGEASHTVEFGGVTYPAGTFGGAYIVSYDSAGSFKWLKAIQGPDNELCRKLKTGPTGNVHVLTTMPRGGTSLDGEVLAAGSAREMAILTFSSTGQLLSVARTLPLPFASGSVLAVGPDDCPVLGGSTVGGAFLDGIEVQSFHTYFCFFTAKVGARRAPTIKIDPEWLLLASGEEALLTAAFDASAPYSLYWRKNYGSPSEVVLPELWIENATFSHTGFYSLVVSNDLGTVESEQAYLWVVPPPAISQGAVATNLWYGETLKLGITVSSAQLYSVQWYFNSTPINGANDVELTINDVNLTHEGSYSVTVSNRFGQNTKSAAVKVGFIPIESPRDMIHDPVQNQLYITTGSLLNRYNITNKSFISAISMLGPVYGVDLSEDYRMLALATSKTAGLTSYVFTVTFDIPTKTNAVPLARTNGAVDVASRSLAFGHGYDFVATLDAASMPFFWGQAETKQSSVFGSNYHNAYVSGGAGRSAQAVISTKNTPGQYFIADADSQTVTAEVEDIGTAGIDVAISRDGHHVLVCRTGKIFDASGGLVATLPGPGFPLGAVYHPQSNYVYCTWSDTSEIRVFETQGYSQVATLAAGATLPYSGTAHPYAPGHLRISVDGNHLFCSLADGIRVIGLPLSPPVVVKPPVDQAKSAGSSVTFGVQATLSPGLSYQWQKNGQNIPDATNQNYTISVIQPDDETGFRVRVSNAAGFVYSEEAHLDVLKADPQLVWSNPATITYGTLLGAAQLNATAVAAGTLTYYPPSGTKLNVGNGQVLQVVFEPEDLEAFERVTNSVMIDVQKKLLSFTTVNASRQYGLPNPQFALNVAGLVAGESLSDIDVLPVVSSAADAASTPGGYPITISGGSDANYSFTYGSATLSIIKRTVTFTLGNLSQAYNGSPRAVSVVTDPPDGVPLNITYNGSTTAPTATGSYAVAVAATGFNHQGNASGTLTIFKDSVPITWTTPADIVYGTALGSGQLNAVPAVSGIYTYTPAAGAILDVGDHTLKLVFTPLDTVNYLRTTNTVTLKVKPRTLTVETIAASREYGAANPTLSGTLSGLRTGEGITVNYGTTANAASPVGAYAITPVFTDPGNRLFNYEVQVTGDPLTVTKAPLAIKANDVSRSYGTEVAYTVEFYGRKNGDQIPTTLSSTATAASVPGTYPITVSLDDADGLPASNYTINLLEGILTVTVDPDRIVIFSPGTLSYVEHSGAQLLDPLAFVTNVFEMSGAVLQLRIINGQAQEQLQLLAEGNGAGEIDLDGNTVRETGVPIATVNGSGANGETVLVEFGAAATMEQATKVLRRVAYLNTSGNPNPSRVVEVRLADINGGISDPATRAIAITLVNDAPQVSWLKPVPGGELKGGYPVVLEVEVTDMDDAVSKVEFWINEEKVAEKTAPPYRHSWTPTATGAVVFKVVAKDATGENTETYHPGNPYAIVPAMATPRFETGNPGRFRFDFIAPNGLDFDVEVSADMVTWTKLTTVTAQAGGVQVIDAGVLGVNRRFYRVVPKP